MTHVILGVESYRLERGEKMTRLNYSVMILAVAAGLRSASAQDAPIIPFDPAGAAFDETHGNGMLGYVFRSKVPLHITQVGWYDEGHDGLSTPTQIGLWRDTSNANFDTASVVSSLLGASGVTIPAGGGTALNGDYRVVTLATPLDLPAGTYEIGGLDKATTADVIKYKNISDPSLPQLDIGQFFYSGTNPGVTQLQVTRADHFYLANGLEIGPMLFSTPEPASLALSATATAMLVRRRRSATKPPHIIS